MKPWPTRSICRAAAASPRRRKVMAAEPARPVPTLAWVGNTDGYLVLIDQTRLPMELVEVECRDVKGVWEAIKSLRVRGAPAIGIAAAYGLCLGLQDVTRADEATFYMRLGQVREELATSRPTAVNLFWALERMTARAETLRGKMSPREVLIVLLAEARAI